MPSGLSDRVFELINETVAESDRERVTRLAARGLEGWVPFAVTGRAADKTDGECVVIEVRTEPGTSLARVGWWYHPDIPDLRHTASYLIWARGFQSAASVGMPDAVGLFV